MSDELKALTEQVAALTKLVTLNMQAPAPVEFASTRGAPVAKPDPEADGNPDVYDAELEAQQLAEAKELAAQHVQTMDQATENLLPIILQDRDFDVLNWMAASMQKTRGQLVQWIIRSHLAKQRVAYREALGGGGASSQNVETLINKA